MTLLSFNDAGQYRSGDVSGVFRGSGIALWLVQGDLHYFS
jgi:hypothetical protein